MRTNRLIDCFFKVWYHYVGYANTGCLCYYGTRSARVGLDRDICQFVPRALVFLVIIILYSRLFTFLRRPDTIQLSCHSTPKTSSIDIRPGQTVVRQPISKLGKLSFTPSSSSPQGPKKEVNPEAPWEAMEFIQVGNVDLLAPAATPTRTFADDCAARPPTASFFKAFEAGSSSTIAPSSKTEYPSGNVQLPYDGNTSISPSSPIGSSGVEVSQTSTAVASASCNKIDPPLLESERKVVGLEKEGEEEEEVGKEDEGPEEQQGQTLKEFFAEHRVSAAELGAVGKCNGQQRSAASYFNRQASLLMLYFPIAVSFFSFFSWTFCCVIFGSILESVRAQHLIKKNGGANTWLGFPVYGCIFCFPSKIGVRYGEYR